MVINKEGKLCVEFNLLQLPFLLQLSLTQSDISHIGSMRVEGIVHPTTAEIDLKEDIGKIPRCDHSGNV